VLTAAALILVSGIQRHVERSRVLGTEATILH